MLADDSDLQSLYSSESDSEGLDTCIWPPLNLSCPPDTLRCLQWNYNNASRTRLTEILLQMEATGTKLCALQETRWHQTHDPPPTCLPTQYGAAPDQAAAPCTSLYGEDSHDRSRPTGSATQDDHRLAAIRGTCTRSRDLLRDYSIYSTHAQFEAGHARGGVAIIANRSLHARRRLDLESPTI